MKQKFEDPEFTKYREQMHGVEEDNAPAHNKPMRTVFALIMVIVYIGMGILMLTNFFDQWPEKIIWMRYFIGIVLILYGIYRAYRYYAGVDYRS